MTNKRQRHVSKEISNSEFAEQELLTRDEVFSVVEFAKAMSGMGMGAYLTPDLINSRMRDLNLTATQATESSLATALANPKDSEKQLREFSQSFEITSQPYKRIINYLSDSLSFDITYSADAEFKEYKTKKYKDDLKSIEKFLDGFDYKKEFPVVVREMIRNDAYFCAVRDVGNGQIILQELPAQYCKITGKWAGGFLFSFDMSFFLLPGSNLEMWPPFFTKKYK